jgi:hypothetical protein
LKGDFIVRTETQSSNQSELHFLADCLRAGLHKMAGPYLPYGIWRCANGREVLFDRSYRPLYQRLPNGKVKDADPGEWVEFEQQEILFPDGALPPYRRYEAVKHLRSILVDWGLIYQCKEKTRPLRRV